MFATVVTVSLLIFFAEAAIKDIIMKKFATIPGQADIPVSGLRVSQGVCAMQCLASPCAGFAMSLSTGHCQLTLSVTELSKHDNWILYKEEVILNREDDSVNFNRGLIEYKSGFGDENGNFWIGLDKLHALTTINRYGLGVNITAWDGTSLWAFYSSISVGPESDDYRLSVSGYDITSTAGDSLTYHNGKRFTTFDRDNDNHPSENCAQNHKGGYWYNYCIMSNPTGKYLIGGVNDMTGINWKSANGFDQYYSFRMIRFTLFSL